MGHFQRWLFCIQSFSSISNGLGPFFSTHSMFLPINWLHCASTLLARSLQTIVHHEKLPALPGGMVKPLNDGGSLVL
jgi:hypothetical protein